MRPGRCARTRAPNDEFRRRARARPPNGISACASSVGDPRPGRLSTDETKGPSQGARGVHDSCTGLASTPQHSAKRAGTPRTRTPAQTAPDGLCAQQNTWSRPLNPPPRKACGFDPRPGHVDPVGELCRASRLSDGMDRRAPRDRRARRPARTTGPWPCISVRRAAGRGGRPVRRARPASGQMAGDWLRGVGFEAHPPSTSCSRAVTRE